MIWPKEVTLVSRTQPSGPLCLWQRFKFWFLQISSGVGRLPPWWSGSSPATCQLQNLRVRPSWRVLHVQVLLDQHIIKAAHVLYVLQSSIYRKSSSPPPSPSPCSLLRVFRADPGSDHTFRSSSEESGEDLSPLLSQVGSLFLPWGRFFFLTSRRFFPQEAVFLL